MNAEDFIMFSSSLLDASLDYKDRMSLAKRAIDPSQNAVTEESFFAWWTLYGTLCTGSL